jgi:exodeoxyribonuclease V beta subunit
VQWTVFERAFGGGTLVTVGDPKQAIYRFPGSGRARLPVGGRAGPGAHALGQPPLGRPAARRSRTAVRRSGARRPRITFAPVQPAPNAPIDALGIGAAVQLRVVLPREDLMSGNDKTLAVPLVRRWSSPTSWSGSSSCSTTGRSPRGDEEPEPVRPGDIAVLVPSHAEASNVAEALDVRGCRSSGRGRARSRDCRRRCSGGSCSPRSPPTPPATGVPQHSDGSSMRTPT